MSLQQTIKKRGEKTFLASEALMSHLSDVERSEVSAIMVNLHTGLLALKNRRQIETAARVVINEMHELLDFSVDDARGEIK